MNQEKSFLYRIYLKYSNVLFHFILIWLLFFGGKKVIEKKEKVGKERKREKNVGYRDIDLQIFCM